MNTNHTAEANGMTLSDWRTAMGFSQREAAEALGCSRTSYARWESGEARPPKYIILASAAIALGIKAEGAADEPHEDEE